jgi:ABC-type phosphate transport system permease subunit
MSNGTLTADASSTGERLRLAGRPRVGEAVVRGALVACGWFVLGTTVAMLGFLARTGLRGLSEVGVGSIFASDTWKPEAG